MSFVQKDVKADDEMRCVLFTVVSSVVVVVGRRGQRLAAVVDTVMAADAVFEVGESMRPVATGTVTTTAHNAKTRYQELSSFEILCTWEDFELRTVTIGPSDLFISDNVFSF